MRFFPLCCWLLSVTRAALAILALGMALSSPAFAQDAPIPERFTSIAENTDFPGGDMVPIFNSTLEQCQSACLRQPDCVGFTFNSRNGSCFPKSEIGAPSPYEGAISGILRAQSPGALSAARTARADLDFLDTGDLVAARRFASEMALQFFANGLDEGALMQGAQGAAAAGDRQRAIQFSGAAVTVNDSATAWAAHAEALMRAADADQNNRYDLSRRASLAAINAALRQSGGAPRAAALVTLARALDAQFRGEQGLSALRVADRLAPGIAPQSLLEARARYGFRYLDHEIDAATVAPRICAQFSQDLAMGRDYAPFVQLSASGYGIEVEGAQLCLTGLAYGETYALSLRAGLPSANSDTLARTVDLQVYIRDRAPLLRFAGRAYVLPATGPRALPIETVNTDTVDLELMRISDRNLVAAIRDGNFAQAMSVWEGERVTDALAEPVWQGVATVENPLNRAATTALPLDAAGPLAPGAYLLRAVLPGADPYDVTPALQWFMVSDLGIATLSGNDGLHVVVQRLSDAAPVAGARVDLVAQSNRVLATATSDAQGHVRFAPALSLGSGASSPAMVLVEDASGDTGVLSLAEPEFDLSDRGVEGRAAPGPVDVFVTTDRGAYRAGEVIHLTALARDPSARALPAMALIARLIRPDGVEYSRALSNGAGAGGHVLSLPLGADVPRGTWRIALHADPAAPALAEASLLVEDFLPERIDFDLTLIDLPDAAAIDLAAPPSLGIEARYLFGAPAAMMTLEGGITLRAIDRVEGWPGFRFGRHDQPMDPQRRFFDAGQGTDASGRLQARLPLDRLTLENRPLTLEVTAALRDGSARPVERSQTRPLRPTGPIVGISPGFDGALPENSDASFDLIALGPDGRVLDGDLDWQIDRIETRYQWFSIDGRWNWEPMTTRARIAEGRVNLAGQAARVSAPVAWGRFEVRVTRTGTDFASASIPFSAGWVAAPSLRETPDLLAVSLDRDSYSPGDTARLRMTPQSDGMALVSVLSERVIDMQMIALTAGETTLDLPVTSDWGTGAYVTVQTLRPMGGVAGQMPARALGLAHAAIDPGTRALSATLTVPDEVRPRERMTAVLQVENAPQGPVHATIAAVDLGILNLTRFASPDPQGYYFGQRRLGVGLRDIYGRLIDGSQGTMGQVRSGGDAGAAGRAGPAPTEDLLALFSGPVTLTDGRAEIGFDLPAFNGTVRLMAVLWSDAALGQASADVIVADPVVVQATLPRVMAPNDVSRMRLELTHARGPAGQMSLSVTGHGIDPADVPGMVTLGQGQAQVFDLPLTPDTSGTHVYTVTLTTPDGLDLTRELRLSVQHNDPEIARSSQFTLAPGQEFILDDTVLAGLRPGTGRAALVAGSAGALDLAGLVSRLMQYPYGCTEQVASALTPLLLTGNAVVELGLIAREDIAAQVQAGIDSILSRQGRNGGFGLWQAGGFDLWLDAYATDMLMRARDHGAEVPERALRSALDNLRNRTGQAGEMFDGGAGYAYAFYVLARAGEAAIGDLRYYADARAEAFDTPLASAQMGAALAVYGEQIRADALFRQAMAQSAGDGPGGWRADYGTSLRDRAGLLALGVEAGSTALDRAALTARIAAGPGTNSLSTQEAAWILRAASALDASSNGLIRDGVAVSGAVMSLTEGRPAHIRNAGEGDVTLTLTSFGVPDLPEPAGGTGYAIARSYYTPDGLPADLSTLRVGDRLVAVIEVTPDAGIAGGRLMIDDALPAGFEIDNPNLLRSGDTGAFEWLALTDTAEMTEARAERFLAAIDWTSPDTLRLAYALRAVSPGEFHHPAAAIEDMYRPTFRARTDTGRLIIAP